MSDDCKCFGKTFDDRLYSLKSTLERFKQYNLKLKLSKLKMQIWVHGDKNSRKCN